ncbi:peptidylprolyl isomerase [Leucobacter sp. CSA2]|uniref:Peptidylprolyl isomerase n=1 Tax=Leucobacter edaphi TaxID=2796472 RepID=A0A934QC17_9MICO|nr:peptidylprolyl isomerase [Leucobacter edaphi]MBK0421408.1 peptidylprolyl isomerase [Leucobacter edaphi]
MLRRFVPATAAATLLIAGLTGCSAQQAAQADCTPAYSAGSLSDGTTVLGEFGSKPEVSIPKDVKIDTTQRTVVGKTGTGTQKRERMAVDQTLVSVNMVFFDAATSKKLYASPAFNNPGQAPEFLMLSKEQENPLSKAVECTRPGDRVVAALSPQDSAGIMQQLGGTMGSSLVGVIDIVEARPLASQGPVKGLPNGYPAVVTNEDGRPGVVLPPTDKPAGSSSAVRIQGDGAEVKATDNVIAQVLTVGWDHQITNNTWDTGIAGLGNEQQISQSGFTYRTELTGKKVGSQVVVIDDPQGGKPSVSVIDILGVN